MRSNYPYHDPIFTVEIDDITGEYEFTGEMDDISVSKYDDIVQYEGKDPNTSLEPLCKSCLEPALGSNKL